MVLLSNWCILFCITFSARFYNSDAAGISASQSIDGIKSGTEAYYIQTVTDTIKNTQSSLCYLAIPITVQINEDAWKKLETPAEDDLDRFMVNKTGCSYKAVKQYELISMAEVPFDGESFEFRGAVRAPSASYIGVTWDAFKGYSFWLGWENNTITRIRFGYDDEVLSELPRAGIFSGSLSVDRYVPVYIKLHAGTLTFSQGCDTTPVFTRNVTVARGQLMKLVVQPWAENGGKYLFGCPA